MGRVRRIEHLRASLGIVGVLGEWDRIGMKMDKVLGGWNRIRQSWAESRADYRIELE